MSEYSRYDGGIDSDGFDDDSLIPDSAFDDGYTADTSSAAAMAASGPLPPVVPSVNSNSGSSMINNQNINFSTMQAPLAQQTAALFPAVASPLLVQQQFFPPPQQFLFPPPLAAQPWNTAPQAGGAGNFVTGNFLQAPQLQLVDPSDTALPHQDLASKQSMEAGYFRKADDQSRLNFNNLLLLQPYFVRALERQHPPADCTLILQYFIQVVTIYPSQKQEILDKIFDRRNDKFNPSNPPHELHELDPLRKFANTNGVPPRGFVLATSPVVQLRPGTKYIRGETGFQLPGYPSNRAPVPIGTTLHELAWWYPNHCHYELCDAFLQYDLTNEAAGRAMSQDVRTKMDQLDVVDSENHVPSAVTNRLRARKQILCDWLGGKYGSAQGLARIEAYLGSKIKLFEVGEPIGAQSRIVPGRSSTIHSAEFRRLAKKIAKEQQTAEQAQPGNTPYITPPSTAGLSPVSNSGPENQTLTPASSVSLKTNKKKSRGDPRTKHDELHTGQAQPLQDSSAENSEIDCIPTVQQPLGRAGKYQFWSNDQERKDFLTKTSSGRQRQTQLLQYVVSHDPYAQTYDHSTMASLTKIVVRSVRQSIVGKNGGASSLGAEHNNDEISFGSEQLYRELNGHFRAIDDDSGSVAGAEAVSRIKDVAILTMQEEDRALTMVLAAKVAAIISGERTSILEDTNLMSGLLPEPNAGSRKSIVDFQGKFCSEKNPLSYALAVRIIKGANRALEETVSPLEYLSEVKAQCSDLLDTCKKGVKVLDVPLDANLMEQGLDALELLLNFTTGRVDGMLRSRNKAPRKRKREKDTGAVDTPSPKIQRLDNDLPSRVLKKPARTKGASLSPRVYASAPPAASSNSLAVQSSTKRAASPPSPRKRPMDESEDITTPFPIIANKRTRWDSGYHSMNHSSSRASTSPPEAFLSTALAGGSEAFLNNLGAFTSAAVDQTLTLPNKMLDSPARNAFDGEFDRINADYAMPFSFDQGADQFAMNQPEDFGDDVPGEIGIDDLTEYADAAQGAVEPEAGGTAVSTDNDGGVDLTQDHIAGWTPHLGAEQALGAMYKRFSFHRTSDDFGEGEELYF